MAQEPPVQPTDPGAASVGPQGDRPKIIWDEKGRPTLRIEGLDLDVCKVRFKRAKNPGDQVIVDYRC